MSSSPIHVLLIDDDNDIIILIHELLAGMEGWNFKAEWVNNFQRAQEIIAQRRHQIYLVDYKLPDGNGIDLIQEAVAMGMREPMVVVTALASKEVTRQALQAGAADVLDKTELSASLLERVIAYSLERTERLTALHQVQEDIKQQVELRCAGLAEDNRRLNQKLSEARHACKQQEHRTLQALQLLAMAVECHGPDETGDHQQVAQLASAIGTQMGLTRETVDSLYIGGLIHDIGNMQIPYELLSGKQQLSEPEKDILRSHSQLGYELARSLDSPVSIAEMVRQHHERYDGSGYPGHLKGAEILLEARILAVADAVVAMSSDRPYREARQTHSALAEIQRQRGRQFDPDVVDACLQVHKEKYSA